MENQHCPHYALPSGNSWNLFCFQFTLSPQLISFSLRNLNTTYMILALQFEPLAITSPGISGLSTSLTKHFHHLKSDRYLKLNLSLIKLFISPHFRLCSLYHLIQLKKMNASIYQTARTKYQEVSLILIFPSSFTSNPSASNLFPSTIYLLFIYLS